MIPIAWPCMQHMRMAKLVDKMSDSDSLALYAAHGNGKFVDKMNDPDSLALYIAYGNVKIR